MRHDDDHHQGSSFYITNLLDKQTVQIFQCNLPKLFDDVKLSLRALDQTLEKLDVQHRQELNKEIKSKFYYFIFYISTTYSS